jgi:hypothetical protein
MGLSLLRLDQNFSPIPAVRERLVVMGILLVAVAAYFVAGLQMSALGH